MLSVDQINFGDFCGSMDSLEKVRDISNARLIVELPHNPDWVESPFNI
jgi:hypothetical protein